MVHSIFLLSGCLLVAVAWHPPRSPLLLRGGVIKPKAQRILALFGVESRRVWGVRDTPIEVAAIYEVVGGLIERVWAFPPE